MGRRDLLQISASRRLGAAGFPGCAPETFTAEESTQVKIAAAEALYRQGDINPAVTYLGDTLTGHSDPYVRLMVANVPENIGERARPALPQLPACSAQAKDLPKLDLTKLTPQNIETLKKAMGQTPRRLSTHL